MPLYIIGNCTIPVSTFDTIPYLGSNEIQHPADDVILSRTKLELCRNLDKNFLADLFYEIPSSLVQSMRDYNMAWSDFQIYESIKLFIDWFSKEEGRTHYRLLRNVVSDMNGRKTAKFQEMQPNKELVIRNAGPSKISEGETVYMLPPFLPIYGADNSYPLFTVNKNNQNHYALPMILSQKTFIEINDDIDKLLIDPSNTPRTTFVKYMKTFKDKDEFKIDGKPALLSTLKLCMLKKENASAGTVVKSYRTRFINSGPYFLGNDNDIAVNEPFVLRVNSSFATK